MKMIYCPVCAARMFDTSRRVRLVPVEGEPPEEAPLVIKCRRCPTLLYPVGF